MALDPGRDTGIRGGPGARDWLEGAGIGILLTLGLTWNQLSTTHLDLYHKLLPITSIVRAITLWLVLACLLGLAVIRMLDRLDRPGRTLLWAFLFAGLAARTLGGLIVAQVVDRKGITPLPAFAVAGGILLLLWILRRSSYQSMVRGIRTVLFLLGCCIIWVLPTLVIAGFRRQPHDLASFMKPVAHVTTPHRRIIWILFDEMSYDQTFDHRWPSLTMPSFDRLRAQSVNFSAMQPDGYYTEEVIPSLLLGKPVAGARSTPGGQLLYRSRPRGSWTRFEGSHTIFADAQRAGWTSGISGDYNPYCRLLQNQLDWCRMNLIVWGDHLQRDKTSWQNFTAPARASLARLRNERFEPAVSEAAKFQRMVDSAKRLIADEDIDFVFIHLYLPHPPGIYDRETSQVKRAGSYIDNLALADRTLDGLEATLAQTRSAEETTLVVSSDHSWRVGLWRHGMRWTREDELASGHGQFDPRPMLLVRLPKERAGAVVHRPISMLGLHEMFEPMIAGQIQTPQQLEQWAATQ